MNILHLSTHSEGGAAKACLRLHAALCALGVNSRVLCLYGKNRPEENIFSLEEEMSPELFASLRTKAERERYFGAWKIRLRGKPPELFSLPFAPWKTEDHPFVDEADIIHLHWVSGMIDIPRFFSKIKKPVVWTLHDAWPFTGGFHYESYFDTTPFRKISAKYLDVKKKSYTGKKIALVAPSGYMTTLCRKSRIFGENIHLTIPNAVPAAVYHPAPNRDELRTLAGIKKEEFVLFFSSFDLGYYRKGADILLHAFYSWKNENVRLIIAGHNKEKLNDARINYTGYLHDEKKMAEWINIADCTVHTAREDNFPNSILESLFCGTPVLAFSSGGIPELIHSEENGWLVEKPGEMELKNGFEKIRELNFSRAAISAQANEKFSESQQAARMIELYTKL